MARKKTKKKKATRGAVKTARLNLMIRPDLREWVHRYARRRGKSVSAMITEHFIELKERDVMERKRGAEVDQI